MAVGATEGDIHRMILRQAVALGLAGVVFGCCLAAVIRPLLSRLKWDVSIPVPPAIVTAGLLLVLIVPAGWLPARRAARISPSIALKAE
jgi:ABC-type antimicrobial peptide transport system permease subunit